MPMDPVLTSEEKDHFLNHGWVKIPQAFTKEQAAQMTRSVWTRLGMDPNDKSTWHTQRTHMPSHNAFDASAFAPRAWAAICELCGGEDRITLSSKTWHDSLIVNLGSPEHEGRPDPPRALTNWHVDGDFFVHYLDSPEQALLVIPLLTDVAPGGGSGATMLFPPGMRAVARHLRAHPEGVSPRMAPRAHPDFSGGGGGLEWFKAVASRGDDDDDYVEACGDAGDVYLLHPLMLHSATNNARRNVRIITNPPVSLREPFCFDRPDGAYSLVEGATLRMLGMEEKGGLKGWAITHPRERVVPERLKIQERMKQEELRRLKAVGKGEGQDAVAAA